MKEKKREQLLADLQPVLHAEEKVLALATGLIDVKRVGTKTSRRGTLAATNQRLLGYTKKLGGHDVVELPYHLISAVNSKKGFGYGKITLASSGGDAEMSSIDKDDVDPLVTAIREQMAAAGPGARAESRTEPDVTDQLKKLGELRDLGVLTPEEFEAKKSELLKRL
jgi:Bacterial PH domain/Short C-terminal domain